ncbi:MAG: SRPBCC domain-containing protein [Acidimicrobiia bacterium]|nr:SRPBCC domain-containing protein [Acidimicrobiia bacterium]
MSGPTGVASESKSLFRRSVAVSITIKAKSERVWGLLTNAADIPRWNSTVSSVEGRIAPGERIKLKAPISSRTFNLTVETVEPPTRLVWSDGSAVFRGVRAYTLAPNHDGSTTFAMEETFTGFMLPLIGLSLPDFKPVFEQYAADLKREAERTSH